VLVKALRGRAAMVGLSTMAGMLSLLERERRGREERSRGVTYYGGGGRGCHGVA
jgi:hypothetical protein